MSAGLAAVAGILVAFRGQLITYHEFNVFASINSLGHAVIGGLGFVLGAVFGAPNAIGGFGTRIVEDWVSLEDRWDLILGSLVLFLILIFHQNGIADVATAHGRGFWEKLRLVRPARRAPAAPARGGRAGAAGHAVDRRPHRAVRLGGGGAGRVDGGPPGRGRRPDRTERRREDDAHRRGDRLRAGRGRDRSPSTAAASTG